MSSFTVVLCGCQIMFTLSQTSVLWAFLTSMLNWVNQNYWIHSFQFSSYCGLFSSFFFPPSQSGFGPCCSAADHEEGDGSFR